MTITDTDQGTYDDGEKAYGGPAAAPAPALASVPLPGGGELPPGIYVIGEVVQELTPAAREFGEKAGERVYGMFRFRVRATRGGSGVVSVTVWELNDDGDRTQAYTAAEGLSLGQSVALSCSLNRYGQLRLIREL